MTTKEKVKMGFRLVITVVVCVPVYFIQLMIYGLFGCVGLLMLLGAVCEWITESDERNDSWHVHDMKEALKLMFMWVYMPFVNYYTFVVHPEKIEI